MSFHIFTSLHALPQYAEDNTLFSCGDSKEGLDFQSRASDSKIRFVIFLLSRVVRRPQENIYKERPNRLTEVTMNWKKMSIFFVLFLCIETVSRNELGVSSQRCPTIDLSHCVDFELVLTFSLSFIICSDVLRWPSGVSFTSKGSKVISRGHNSKWSTQAQPGNDASQNSAVCGSGRGLNEDWGACVRTKAWNSSVYTIDWSACFVVQGEVFPSLQFPIASLSPITIGLNLFPLCLW